MIPGYPIGSSLTILNTIYIPPQKDQKTNKYGNDEITIVFRDDNTGDVKKHTFVNPVYELWVLKDPSTAKDYNELFIEIDKVECHKILYKDLLKSIAELTGNMEFFKENIRNGNYAANKQLFTDTTIFNADMDIQDHYRYLFSVAYPEPDFRDPSMAFLDIEVAIRDINEPVSSYMDSAKYPINAISIVDDKTNTVYTGLLRDESNPLIQEMEDMLNDPSRAHIFFDELDNEIRLSCQTEKNYLKLECDKLQYNIKFFDDELDMLEQIYIVIHTLKPELILIWNMAYDAQYIKNRLNYLTRGNADKVMCSPDFTNKVCKYFYDERMGDIFEERGDFFECSSYSTYLCQMINYASRRKGQTKHSNKLDDVALMTSKVRKTDYKHITHDISKFPMLNYRLFVIYNIVDTLVQRAVERNTGDIKYIYSKALINATRYHKAHRQTIYLTNRGTIEFRKRGLIIGNNVNKFKPKPDVKYPGALVGSPLNNDPEFYKNYEGIPLRVAANVVDYDYTALYPSEMDENNIGPNTEVGKIIIEKAIFDGENPFNSQYYDRGGAFIEDYVSGNIVEFSRRWFDLPGVKEMHDWVIEYYTTIANSSSDINYFNYQNGLFSPFRILVGDGLKPAFTINEFDNNFQKPFAHYHKFEGDIV